MRFDVELPDFRALAASIEGEIAEAATEAVRETAPIAAQELREQVTSAGLGQRLANTWRWRTYPDTGRRRFSLEPAGYIWSRAPEIIDSFQRGAQIVPLNGRKFLAIPTKDVPRTFGRTAKRMTPEQVELAFNQDLIVRPGKLGRLLAFLDVTPVRKQQRVRGRRPAGAKRKLKLMFVLVPTVRMPKLLDIEPVAARWAQRFEAAFNRRLA